MKPTLPIHVPGHLGLSRLHPKTPVARPVNRPLAGAVIPNHAVTRDGALAQVHTTPRTYDAAYVAAYNALDCQRMSELRVQLVARYCQESLCGKLLDFGCGNGAFLHELQRRYDAPKAFGWDIAGYTQDMQDITMRNPASHHWGVVTFWDSLEHVPDIDGLLRSFTADYLVVSLPWCHAATEGPDWFAKWKHHKPNEHLWYFDAASLCNLMARHGYRPVFIGNPEDKVRVGPDHRPNILTGVFQRVKPHLN